AVRAVSVVDRAGTAPRAIYQTEGLLYRSYVQAAVYDAATKIGHRYVPYHRVRARGGHASIEAAVIAAAYNTLVDFLGDPNVTLTGTPDIDVTIPGATNGGTTLTTSQPFKAVDDLLTQLVNARVWIGFHFRDSVVTG